MGDDSESSKSTRVICLTQNENALEKYFLYAPEVLRIVSSFFEKHCPIEVSKQPRKSYQFQTSTLLRIFHNAAIVKESIRDHCGGNPFQDNTTLINIASSVKVPESAKDDILNRDQKGQLEFEEFVRDRLQREHAKLKKSRHSKDETKNADEITKVREDDDESSFLFIEKSLTNITKDSGDMVRMRCEVRGHPVPKIRWYKNEAPLEPERGKVDVRKYSNGYGRIGSRLKIVHVDIHDTGYYKCEATNEKHSVETTGILMVKAGRMHSPSLIPDFPPPHPHFPALGGRLPEFEQNDLGFCQHYRGVACSQLIGNRTVYVKTKMTLNQMEEKLAAIFTILATGKEMSPECHKYAVPFFCYVMFPPCDDSVPYPVPRHVCRDDCEVLEASTCKEEMASARKHPLLANQDLVPECEELPSPVPDAAGSYLPGKDGQGNCISLRVPRVIQVDLDVTCYEGRGENYRGPVSHTLSSHQCQSWSPVAEYEELSGGHNYCRNPGGLESQPWCFISDPQMRREVCDIPRCVAYDWLYIFLPSLIAAVLLGLLIGLWCKRQRRKTCSSKLSPQSISEQLIPTHLQTSNLSHPQPIEMQKVIPRIPMGIHEVSPQSIRFLHELGDGMFGKVYRGEMHHPKSANGTTVIYPVAIKTLKENAPTQARQEFCKELEKVAVLQHPNVVCLVAVCVRQEPLCMLYEYNFQCDLQEFLLIHSPHSDVAARSDDGTPQILEISDFLTIAIQVASGMDYLSTKCYVHRDLAARNCLVSAEPIPTSLSQSCVNSSSLMDNILVKISDLGVSRNSCAREYFRVRNTLLPVRWMAPESLLYGTFTTESDVWSFGVLLWEIFSYGIRPYFNCDNQEVIDLICTHQLLPRPEYCPPHVYAIMHDCWHDSPSHRPNFKELYNRLCSAQTLHERTYSISHSVLTHNSSHQSSTGPSNRTLSTNLSCGTENMLTTVRPNDAKHPFCGTGPNFVSSKLIPTHRTHQCEKV